MDISSSTTAHAVCRRIAEAGERLPGPWLIDRDGNPSDDPRQLINDQGGSLLPLGGMDLGYKGFALALLVEALTNALGGHGRADGETRWGASVFLQIINPDCFGGRENFLRESSFLGQSCIELLRSRANRPCVCQDRPPWQSAKNNSRTASNSIRPYGPHWFRGLNNSR